ncbi:nuclear transport factor 2 family protein [Rathayibacter sp. KR2-224]|uniref:nuclear transport factor 2 family protein n=1 Tax=Rathayibacter sp. KR2-224 TaxID=3400913 RepID=UPI003BFB4D3C
MLTVQDRLAISETLALHAYIVDENQLDRMDELFTSDAVYDMTLSGFGSFEGIDSIGAAAAAMNESGHAPLAHFVTNIIAAGSGEDEAAVQSKGLMIMADGSIHAVTYQDTFRVDDGAWRISRRVVIPRHTDRTEQ